MSGRTRCEGHTDSRTKVRGYTPNPHPQTSGGPQGEEGHRPGGGGLWLMAPEQGVDLSIANRSEWWADRKLGSRGRKVWGILPIIALKLGQLCKAPGMIESRWNRCRCPPEMPVRPGVCRDSAGLPGCSACQELPAPGPRVCAALEPVSGGEWAHRHLGCRGGGWSHRGGEGRDMACIALESAPDREVHPRTAVCGGRQGWVGG